MTISWELIMPLLLLQLLLVIIAITNCIKAEKINGPKWMWIIVIVCLNIIGPILYFVFGKRKEG